MNIEEIKAQAELLASELEALLAMLKNGTEEQAEERFAQYEKKSAELRKLNAEIAKYRDSVPAGMVRVNGELMDERTAAVNGLLGTSAEPNTRSEGIPGIVLASAVAGQTRKYGADKVLYRHDEKLTGAYNTAGISAEKVLRAAITGNYAPLSDVEKRALTPTTGGAMLSPEVSSIIIDNLRQSDWMQIFQPTIVNMETETMKIPNITGLPTTVMHTPGQEETPTDPTIVAATLNAKTMMTLTEVAKELLQDSPVSQGAILQACTDSISNKLLQQVLYGTGSGAEMKGITLYDTAGFADAGDKSAEKDLFNLATLADMAIIKKNGVMDAMLYDPDLEPRLNKRLATGELVQPSRAFQRLYDAGRTLAHPSIAAGDMLFWEASALFIGMRLGIEVNVDNSSAFNSYNTKFQLILRADCFANTPRMAYYSGITTDEPT